MKVVMEVCVRNVRNGKVVVLQKIEEVEPVFANDKYWFVESVSLKRVE